MVADYYGVDERTIELLLVSNEEELKHNGYFLCKGKELKDFKLQYVKEIDFPNKTPQLGVFDFRSFLNIDMLLTTSEKAKQVRSLMLDIVISVINEKSGGGTKYINRRDRNYISSAIQEENYHQKLTDAIKVFVDGHNVYKYPTIIDMIYKVCGPNLGMRQNGKQISLYEISRTPLLMGVSRYFQLVIPLGFKPKTFRTGIGSEFSDRIWFSASTAKPLSS